MTNAYYIARMYYLYILPALLAPPLIVYIYFNIYPKLYWGLAIRVGFSGRVSVLILRYDPSPRSKEVYSDPKVLAIRIIRIAKTRVVYTTRNHAHVLSWTV